MSYAPPPGAPPRTANVNPFNDTSSTANHADNDSTSDPPPAYTPSVNMGGGEASVQSGPTHVDFSGPPPIPDRFTSQQTGVGTNVTGVGVGYGQRPSGGGGLGYSSGGGQGSNVESKPSLPPRHPSAAGQPSGSRPPPPSSAGSQAQPQDLTPTEQPTPGRPLLHRGQLLVYPPGFVCPKCANTGYKSNDPSNPHEVDWRKYGRPYTSALAHSYTISISNNVQGTNPSTQASSNFQRPLPSYAPAGSSGSNPHAHLPPPPGKWGSHPGQGSFSHAQQPPPPPSWPGPGQQIFVQATAGPAPPGALVVKPGDPRIGGRLCWRCAGSGRELGFFGFDDRRCGECRGLGRLF